MEILCILCIYLYFNSDFNCTLKHLGTLKVDICIDVQLWYLCLSMLCFVAVIHKYVGLLHCGKNCLFGHLCHLLFFLLVVCCRLIYFIYSLLFWYFASWCFRLQLIPAQAYESLPMGECGLPHLKHAWVWSERDCVISWGGLGKGSLSKLHQHCNTKNPS